MVWPIRSSLVAPWTRPVQFAGDAPDVVLFGPVAAAETYPRPSRRSGALFGAGFAPNTELARVVAQKASSGRMSVAPTDTRLGAFGTPSLAAVKIPAICAGRTLSIGLAGATVPHNAGVIPLPPCGGTTAGVSM